MTKNGAKCASVDLVMIWNNRLSKGIISAQNDVASMLSAHRKADLLQGPHDL